MNLEIKFTDKELDLIEQSLMLGSIHNADQEKGNKMHELKEKMRVAKEMSRQM